MSSGPGQSLNGTLLRDHLGERSAAAFWTPSSTKVGYGFYYKGKNDSEKNLPT
jgi:hypothetical protein